MSAKAAVLIICIGLVLRVGVSVSALEVDFNAPSAPSPGGWAGWTGTEGDAASTTIDGVTINLTNQSTGGHGGFIWVGDYTAVGGDGLEDMIEDAVALHGADDGLDWQSGDVLAMGLSFSGLKPDMQYEITTWHNHNWNTPTIDISVGGVVVVDSLANTVQVNNSDAAASATFSFISDAAGVSPEIRFTTETPLGAIGNNAHLQITPQINGFELTELGFNWMNKATEPNPEDGSSNHIASELSELSWTPGQDAIKHAIYLGESFESVDSASDPNSGVGLGLQDANSISINVGYETEYFWRIDEYNSAGTWTKGEVWSFETAAATSWVESLKVDFNNQVGAPSPTGWTGWFGAGDDGSVSSTTINDITIYLSNHTTGGHGDLIWYGDYTASGSDGLEDMVEDAVAIHGSDNEWDANGFKSGDVLAIGMSFSGLMINTQYEITTWHNHNWNRPTLDISVGGMIVVDSLAHTFKVNSSDAAATATFTFITDEAGVSPEILFTSEIALGNPKGNAHLQITPHINGFDLKTAGEPVIGFNQRSSSGFEDAEGPVLVDVALGNPAPGVTYTVDYMAGGTATQGDDYALPQPQRLTFAPGEFVKTISIDINDDRLDEEDETVILELSNPTGGAKVGYPDYTYTIIDIRPKISFVAGSSSGSESVTPAMIEVKLNKDEYIKGTERDTITVDYEVTGGTAVNGDKYYLLSPGTLTFPPGVVSGYISLDVVDDNIKIQPDETVVLTLSNPGGPGVLAGITEHTYTFIEDDEGIKWDGMTWYFTNEGKDDNRRLFINDDGDLEWWPQQKSQVVVRIGDQRLSQTGDVVEMTYIWMSDGQHDCDDCYNCGDFCHDYDITCVAGSSDFRAVLAEADGEYTEHDGGGIGNDIYRGYKAIEFRFGPNMDDSRTRWVDCHGETHKSGSINKKPEDSENLAHANDDEQYRELPGFELPPGEYSLFTLRLERNGSNINASITLNGRTYDANIGGGDLPEKIDVFALYLRNGRDYTRVVLRAPREAVTSQPSPADNAEEIRTDVMLSWRGGTEATSYDVYFGGTFDSVNSAARSSGEYKGNQQAETFDPPCLKRGGIYYWRIDDVTQSGTVKGPVWMFTTLPCVPFESFEAYVDSDALDADWSAGGSAWLYLAGEHRTGGKSLELDYYNRATGGGPFSEVSGTFDPPLDWSGSSSVGLYFKGTQSNQNDKLYVVLEDTAGGKASYGGGVSDFRVENWQLWSVAFERFGGLDLSSVKKLTIGVGDRNGSPSGASGILYIDDVGLCGGGCEQTGCVCLGDLNTDSQVDLDDLQAVAGVLLNAGSPFIVQVDGGHCGDLNEDDQVDLDDLQAVAGILLNAGSPFISPCP